MVPESKRSDGSIRKERKIKPGFTALEDVATFESKGQRLKKEAAKKYGVVPGMVLKSKK